MNNKTDELERKRKHEYKEIYSGDNVVITRRLLISLKYLVVTPRKRVRPRIPPHHPKLTITYLIAIGTLKLLIVVQTDGHKHLDLRA